MALQWSLSTSSSSRSRRSSVAITPLCCFVSSQIAGHGWKLEWVQEWFWVESCSNKVHGRLPDCCNPTSTWPADQQFYPPLPSPVRHRSTAPTPAVLLWHTQERNSWHVCNWELTASAKGGWPPRYTCDGAVGGKCWVGVGGGGVFVCVPGVRSRVLH